MVPLLWKIAGGVLLFVVTAFVTLQFMPSQERVGPRTIGNDFLPSFAAGLMVREGQGDQIYNPYAVTRVVRAIWEIHFPGAEASSGLAAWLNPPFFAFLFAPLTGLPYPQALGVWIAINFCLTIAGCALLIRLLPANSPLAVKALVPVLVVSSFPFVRTMTHQQNTMLSLAILAGALVLTMRALAREASESPGRARLAYATGTVAGLLLFKPQLAAVTILALAVVVGFRVLLGAIYTGALLLAVQEWVIPGAAWQFLLEMPPILDRLHERQNYHWDRHVTLHSFWRMLIQGTETGPTGLAVKVLWMASLAAVGLWLARAAWTANRASNPITARRWLAAAICAMPLVMPYFMDYDLLLLATAAALLAGDLNAKATTSISDRRLSWAWVALAAWQAMPMSTASWRVNITAVLLTLVTAMMIRRVKPDAAVEETATMKIEPPRDVRMAA
jgi:hypothetical protein